MNPLQSRLSALRRRLWMVVTFRGLAWLLTLILGTVALAGLVDWRVHLPSLVRAVVLVGLLSGGAYIFYRFLIRPLWARTDDLSLALQVETAYPSLNDSLASTVQFLQQPDGSDISGSPALRRLAVKKTMQQVDQCDFKQVVDTRGIGAAGLSLLGIGALALVLVLLNPSLAWTAFLRLADPFGGNDWPRQTRLELDPIRDRIGRGESLDVAGRVFGVVPEQAVIDLEGLTPSRLSVSITRTDNGSGTFQVKLDRVERSFRLQVRANDAVSEWRSVAVLPPPVLVPLDGRPSPQVHLQFPSYTDLPAVDLPDGSGNIEAVLGTRVTFRAATDRPVVKAWIEYRPADTMTIPLGYLNGLAATADLWSGPTLATAHQHALEPVAARLEQNGQALHTEFTPVLSGMYALHFEDATGLASTRLFDLRIFPDPPPTVTVDRPSKSHESLELLPKAEFTLDLAAEDQQFAVKSVFLQYRCKKEDSPRDLPLYDHTSTGQALAQVMSALAPAPSLSPKIRPQRVPVQRRLSLERFKHADGSALKEGDVLTLQAAANDFDDVNLFKAPGKSHEIEIHIVSPAALERILDRAQAQVQQELLRLQKQQQDALKQVKDAEQQAKNVGKLGPKEMDELLQAEQTQQQIRDRVGVKKDEGLRAEVERILQMLRDNKQPRSGTNDRMEAVAGDLDRLAREELEQIEAALTNTRKEAEAAEPNAKKQANQKNQLAETRRRQEEVETTLSNLLKHLEPWSRIKDIRNETKDVLQEQRKLAQQTKDLSKQNSGATLDKLSPEQKAALGKIAEPQKGLGERTEKLLDKLGRLAEERQSKDPETARSLKEAAQQGKNDNVPGQMRDAAKDISDNLLGKAGEEQQRSAESLEKVAQALEESREKELDQLRKKLKEVEKQLDELKKDQDELRKKSKEAGKIGDPKKREEELKRLAREQEKLQKKAKDLAAELKRLRPDRATARALDGAAGDMEQAGQMLERDPDDADQAQEEALKRLNEAQRRLQQAQEEVEEELAREKLAKVADQIKRLKDRQEAALAEAERIEKDVLENKEWTRQLRASLRGLADTQDGLAQETKNLAEERLAGAKVFTHIISKSAAAMAKAAEQFMEHQKAAENAKEAAAVPEAKKRQQEAIRRLEQLLDALKPDQGLAQRGGDGGGGRGAPGDDIPPLAELKALRGLQKEVNERTEDFAKKHPDPKKLSRDNSAEIGEIRQEQQEVAELLEKMTQPDDAAPKDEPKPAKRSPERKLPNDK